MTRKLQKMVKYQVSKVWQEGVYDESEEREAVDDKEDTEDGEVPGI
jgi:hypothetical protein